MGGCAALRKWKGRNVWRLLRGSDAISCGNCQASAPGGHLPQRHRLQLSRWLDVPGRRVRAVVQRILDHRTGDEHDAAARAIRTESGRLDAEAAADDLSSSGGAAGGGSCSVLCGLARASELRRILEAVVHPGSLRANPGARFQPRRLGWTFSRTTPAELCTP